MTTCEYTPDCRNEAIGRTSFDSDKKLICQECAWRNRCVITALEPALVTVECDRCPHSARVTLAEYLRIDPGADCLTDEMDAVLGREGRLGLIAYLRCTAWPPAWHEMAAMPA